MHNNFASMSWLSSLFGFDKTHEQDNVNVSDLVSLRTRSRRHVNIDTALELPAFYAGAKVLAETIASLKVEVLQRTKDGDTKPAMDHPLHDLVTLQPSPYYSAFTWNESATLHGVYQGNHYSYIKRNNWGFIESLVMLDPETITPFKYLDKLYYRDTKNGYTYLSEEIVHIPWMTLDGINGLSAIEYHAATIAQGVQGKDYGEAVMRNGSFVNGVLHTDKTLSIEGAKKLKSQWAAARGEGAGATPVLEDGVKFQAVQMKPTDLDLINIMKFTANEIAMILRIPLHLLQMLERSTNNNIEHQSIDFVVHTIRPIVKRMEAELNRKLFTQRERAQGYKIRYNIDSLMRGDIVSRSNYYRTMFMIGALNRNEIRRLENMNKIPDGDTFYVMTNMADAETNRQVGSNE